MQEEVNSFYDSDLHPFVPMGESLANSVLTSKAPS